MKRWTLRSLGILTQIFIMLILPFWILIRGSVFLYEVYEWPFWLAIIVTDIIVAFILLVYVAMIWDAIMGPGKISRTALKVKVWMVSLILVGFMGYTFFSLSGANAKGEDVKDEYMELHPYLRLSVGTFVLFNKNLLITDMSRATEDYQKMGLPGKKHSLHYKQSTGFVHAMDLRTKGHSKFRNFMMQAYFRALGFNTLRHTGTADHLHISLSVFDKPGAI